MSGIKMDFINDFLQIDYDKTIKGLCKYAEQNEMYCNMAPALDALMQYKNHNIVANDRYGSDELKFRVFGFDELKFRINKCIDDSEVRKHFGINKNLNIVKEFDSLVNVDIGKSYREDFISLKAGVIMKPLDVVGEVEALIRAGIFYEHDLTVDDFEDPQKLEKMYLSFDVVLSEDEAYIQAEVRNSLGRSCSRFNLSEEEVKSLYEMVFEKTHEDRTFAYRLANDYLTENAEYADYELVEDSYEYDDGYMIVYYADEAHEDEIGHTCIDLKHLENHIPIGFPCRKFSYKNENVHINKNNKEKKER